MEHSRIVERNASALPHKQIEWFPGLRFVAAFPVPKSLAVNDRIGAQPAIP